MDRKCADPLDFSGGFAFWRTKTEAFGGKLCLMK